MCQFPIIFENDDLVVIDKPCDASFHKEDSNSGVYTKFKKQQGYDIWPVHRLDKITSGLLMFAKNKESAALLGQLFEQKRIKKIYLALSDKKPKKKQGLIKGDMKKSRSGSWKLCKTQNNPAVTQFYSASLKPGIRLFIVYPNTGKTHQIRVALKSLGAPILGDQRYGGTSSDRGYLHAYQLAFVWKNKTIKLNSLPNIGKIFIGKENSIEEIINNLSSE